MDLTILIADEADQPCPGHFNDHLEQLEASRGFESVRQLSDVSAVDFRGVLVSKLWAKALNCISLGMVFNNLGRK